MSLRIAAVDPFFGGSHRAWLESYQRSSEHHLDLFGLPPVHWKWRMRSGAIALSKQLIESPETPDLLLATSMLDVALFRSLLPRREFHQVPLALYFHENQLTYPQSPRERQPHGILREFGLRNYTSALVADKCFFNSQFHMDQFLGALSRLEEDCPESGLEFSAEHIKHKCSVLPLGVDLSNLKSGKISGAAFFPEVSDPILLWNHRWDHDKNPGQFFEICAALEDEGVNFKLIVCGETLDVPNSHFEEAKERFGSKILHWGYAESREEYAALLWRADVVISTSKQDFFGASVVEAAYCGAVPVVPMRQAFPEVIDQTQNPECFYRTTREAVACVKDLCMSPERRQALASRVATFVARYDWAMLTPQYDKAFSLLAAAGS